MSFEIKQIASLSSDLPFLLTVIINGIVSCYECRSIHDAKVLWLDIRQSMRD